MFNKIRFFILFVSMTFFVLCSQNPSSNQNTANPTIPSPDTGTISGPNNPPGDNTTTNNPVNTPADTTRADTASSVSILPEGVPQADLTSDPASINTAGNIMVIGGNSATTASQDAQDTSISQVSGATNATAGNSASAGSSNNASVTNNNSSTAGSSGKSGSAGNSNSAASGNNASGTNSGSNASASAGNSGSAGSGNSNAGRKKVVMTGQDICFADPESTWYKDGSRVFTYDGNKNAGFCLNSMAAGEYAITIDSKPWDLHNMGRFEFPEDFKRYEVMVTVGNNSSQTFIAADSRKGDTGYVLINIPEGNSIVKVKWLNPNKNVNFCIKKIAFDRNGDQTSSLAGYLASVSARNITAIIVIMILAIIAVIMISVYQKRKQT